MVTTGTPPGVGLGMKPPTFLKAGDVMKLSIEGLGTQQQKVVPFKDAHYNPLILSLIVTQVPRSPPVIIRPQIDREFAAGSTRRGQEGPVAEGLQRVRSRKEIAMRFISVAPLAAAALAAVGASGGAAFADQAARISGPYTHENLAVYFVHGASAGGRGAAHLAGGAGQGPGAGGGDGPRQRAADREHRRRAGVHPGRRHRQGRQAGPRADGEPPAAGELGARADRLLLRRAGALGGARQGGPREVLERQGGDALALGVAGHGGAAARTQGSP